MINANNITNFLAFAMCLLIFGCAGTKKVSTDEVEQVVDEPTEIPVYEPSVNYGEIYSSISEPEQLTFGEFDNGIGNIHPDGGRIVYQSFQEEKWQLYEKSFSDSLPSLLLDGDYNLENPIWSTDGSVVLYVQTVKGGSGWDRDIYMYDPIEEVSARLTTKAGDDWFPVAVDEASYIFITERDAGEFQPIDERDNSIYRGNLDGSEPLLLTDSSNNFSSPAFIDDSRLIVLTAESRLAIYNGETGTSEIITPSRIECGTCDYNSNSGVVVFSSYGDDSALFFMDLESKVIQEVTLAGEGVRYPRFSPDGAWLLYSALHEGNFQLFRINLTSD